MSDLIPPELLRSIFRIDHTESESDLAQNFLMLRHEVRPLGADDVLLRHLGSIYDRTQKLPDFQTTLSHFIQLVQTAVTNEAAAVQVRLQEVEMVAGKQPFQDVAAFRQALDKYKETVTANTVGYVMQQVGQILQPQGWTPPTPYRGKRVTLQGPRAAVGHIEASMAALAARFDTGEIEGDFRDDAGRLFNQYKQQKTAGFQPGVCSGFTAIDSVHDGLKPGDLALVVGFTSQYKSTFCFNWAYNAAVYFQKNVAIIPMEMTAETLRGMLGIVHCFHPKFAHDPVSLTMNYNAYRRMALNTEQETLLEEALADLNANPDYGLLFYRQPQGTTTIADIRRWAEQKHLQLQAAAAARVQAGLPAPASDGLDLIVVDYLGLVNSSGGENSLRESSVANATLREAKQLCGAFAHGRGIAMLSPWQASREGFKEAEKNKGEYSLRALSWANEAERSSDFVYSVYTDQGLRDTSILKWGNLKARDRELITGVRDLYCNPAARLIAQPSPRFSPVAGQVPTP